MCKKEILGESVGEEEHEIQRDVERAQGGSSEDTGASHRQE